ncbi:hypothetical protein IR152_04760 [Clostridioides sp. ES-S-0108-01]|uniref:cation-transporting P-type ATPase n=1 Tax=Clostridioides sp. ES-S-0108-01 TaxID=2770773 RepID=UPI00302EAF04|nr:hypothetical protein [Clostridioides sp. ES-S-0108-01]UDN52793.1 hypothetical protein JJC16_09340 [Clostridioides sp. ES-S-0107-01]
MENHKQMPWHSRATHEILESLDSSEEGLTDTEAEKRLKKSGVVFNIWRIYRSFCNTNNCNSKCNYWYCSRKKG